MILQCAQVDPLQLARNMQKQPFHVANPTLHADISPEKDTHFDSWPLKV